LSGTLVAGAIRAAHPRSRTKDRQILEYTRAGDGLLLSLAAAKKQGSVAIGMKSDWSRSADRKDTECGDT
jgi:hypothetical protein